MGSLRNPRNGTGKTTAVEGLKEPCMDRRHFRNLRLFSNGTDFFKPLETEFLTLPDFIIGPNTKLANDK